MPLTRPKAAQINFDVTTISDPLLRFNSDQTGSNDKDAGFIIERGDDTNVGLVWDESTDRFSAINTDETGTTSGNVTISSYADMQVGTLHATSFTTSASDAFTLTDTTNDNNAGPIITLNRDKSGTVYDADYLGQIKFKGDNDAGQSQVYAKITAKVLDASAGTEDGIIEYAVRKAGSNTIVARLRSDSFQLLNGTSLSVNGTVDATSYTGDGSGLSGIATNSISQGDSSLSVTDSGTGVATLILDNATHTTFNSSGITLASGVFSGTATSAQYADLAEMYAGDKNYEVGTVVCVGGDKEVTECDAYADSKLAGVVSDKPAYLMNRDIEAEYPICVGFVGRVPIKVVGHISKGDLLTTSEIKGFATKFSQGSYNPGCIIGLSLNDKKYPGEGTVEVLLKRS